MAEDEPLKDIAARIGVTPSFSMTNCTERRASAGYSREKLSVVRRRNDSSKDSSEAEPLPKSTIRAKAQKMFDISVVKRDDRSGDTSGSVESATSSEDRKHRQFTVTKVPKVTCMSADPRKSNLELSVTAKKTTEYDELIDIF